MRIPREFELEGTEVLMRKVTLVTHNLREFQRVPGLSLEDWLGALG